MSLDDVTQEWEALGRRDALWAILTEPGKEGGKWDLDEFFDTGERALRSTFDEPSAKLGLPLQRRTALDFGCGVGRLTQALADRFDRAVGVDAAPSMIEGAREYNRRGDRVEYILNEVADLSVFADATFDLVYSHLVLQHLGPDLAEGYIREFARICAPGGLIAFGVPDSEVAATEMDEEAYRASLRLAGPLPGTLSPNEHLAIQIELRNDSDLTWRTSSGPIGVGNHWLDDEGSTIRYDDGRAYLSDHLGPGASAVLTLSCQTPGSPGRYQLEVDVIHENVAWFVHRGHVQPLRLPLEVTDAVVVAPAGGEEPAIGDDVVEGRMGVYGLPRPRVEAALRETGARLLEVVETPRCGPAWLSFDYYATLA